MASSAIGALGQSGAQNPTGQDAFKNLDLNQFIKLLVAELQNQDPMDPMSNSEMLQQVSQIRAIESNDRLNTTLQSVSLGQNLATAGNLIGRNITGMTDGGDTVTGRVDRVSIEDGVAKLHVGENVVTLSNVGEILPSG